MMMVWLVVRMMMRMVVGGVGHGVGGKDDDEDVSGFAGKVE